MTDFLLQVLREIWSILEDASIFLLIGFVLAGVLAVLVPARAMTRLFGTGRVKSVLWASALGAPLPLCSCGVLPTALGLRRQGATRGPTGGRRQSPSSPSLFPLRLPLPWPWPAPAGATPQS